LIHLQTMRNPAIMICDPENHDLGRKGAAALGKGDSDAEYEYEKDDVQRHTNNHTFNKMHVQLATQRTI